MCVIVSSSLFLIDSKTDKNAGTQVCPEFGRMKNTTHLSAWHPFESAQQSCMFSLQVILKWKIALPIFAQNLEETGKSIAASTDLKEPLSPNSVILTNSSSAIPLLLEAVLLTSPATQSHAIHSFFALPLPIAHQRCRRGQCFAQQDCYQPLCLWISVVLRNHLLYCKCRGGSVCGPEMVALKVFCFVYSVDFPGITKFCISPALGYRDALAAIWPLVHLFPYKCFFLSNHECRIYRIIQYQQKEHIHAWNTIIL